MAPSTSGDIFLTEFKWKINVDEFNSKQKGDSIISFTFSVSESIQLVHLSLFPKGEEDSTDDDIGFYLCNRSDHEITVDCGFSLLNNDNEKVNRLELLNGTLIKSKCAEGWQCFTERRFLFDPANKLIKDGKFTIVSNFYEGGVNVEKKYQIMKGISEKLFTNKAYSDVTVKCGRSKFYLHKSILATRSSVFEAMFQADMIEKKENLVVINDVNPKVMQQFFKYLYINIVDDFKKIAKDLLVVADKYLVKDLKDDCEDIMCCNINVKNAIEYFKISVLHNALNLKSELIKFMASNITKFINNPEFKLLTQDQLLEIMSHHLYLTKNNK